MSEITEIMRVVADEINGQITDIFEVAKKNPESVSEIEAATYVLCAISNALEAAAERLEG